jgi:WD40 repeat protein
MPPIRRHSLCAIVLILLLLPATAACVPAAVEPEAAQTSVSVVETPPVLAAYPGAPTFTPLPPPYPWPTASPGPTDAPEPTAPPEPTEPPPPTLPPTPVVTPIPTAEPPFIPLPDGTTPQPFSLYWREGDVIRTMRSDEGEPRLFLDPAEEFGLYLPPPEAGIRTWGAAAPDGRTMAMVLAEEPQPVFVEDLPYPVHIYLLDQETRDLRLLVKNGLDPVWSPDGKRLAYRSTETGGLWVAEVESGVTVEVYKVDRANAHTITAITWAPDSRRLAVLDEVFFESPALFIVDLEWEGPPQQLIDPSSNWVSSPQWSPRDDQISFLWGVGERDGGVQLRIVNFEGKQQQLVHGVFAGGGSVNWSPDGLWLIYSGTARYEPLPPQIDLWLVTVTDGLFKRITFDDKAGAENSRVNDSNPMWAPDGTQIVFQKDSELWVLSLLEGGQRKLWAFPNGVDVGLVLER